MAFSGLALADEPTRPSSAPPRASLDSLPVAGAVRAGEGLTLPAG